MDGERLEHSSFRLAQLLSQLSYPPAMKQRKSAAWFCTGARIQVESRLAGATGFELPLPARITRSKGLQNQQSSQRDLGRLRTHPYIYIYIYRARFSTAVKPPIAAITQAMRLPGRRSTITADRRANKIEVKATRKLK